MRKRKLTNVKREVFRYNRKRVALEPEGTLDFYRKNGNCSDETVDFVDIVEVDERDLQGYETIRAIQVSLRSEKMYPSKESF